MKKLQKDYTTPEQSERLVELGVPEDSANKAYMIDMTDKIFYVDIPEDTTYTRFAASIRRAIGYNYFPAWTVGRLIEIMTICYKWDFLLVASFRIYREDIISRNLINTLINDLSLEISRGKMDFSKLEEEK